MAETAPPVCAFGLPAADFRLRDTEGMDAGRCSGTQGRSDRLHLNHCPFVLAVADKLAAEGRALAELGIGMAAICSNDAEAYPADSYEKMGSFAREHGFPFPYLHDPDQRVARAYGAVCTPDFFGYNADLALQYRGRLDDSGRSRRPDARRELHEAMRQIAETGQGPREQTASIGCSIKWKAA